MLQVQKQTRELWLGAEDIPQVAIGGRNIVIVFRKVDDLMIFLSSEVGDDANTHIYIYIYIYMYVGDRYSTRLPH